MKSPKPKTIEPDVQSNSVSTLNLKTFRVGEVNRDFYPRRAKIAEIQALDELGQRENKEIAARRKITDAGGTVEGTLTDETFDLLEFVRQMLEKRAVDGQPLSGRELLDGVDPEDVRQLIRNFKTGEFHVSGTDDENVQNVSADSLESKNALQN
jgi:hypothetical protein